MLGTGIEDGQPRPLFWTRQAGKGRVFVSIPGHFTWTFDDPLFRVLILRGIAWTAREPVDRFNELATLVRASVTERIDAEVLDPLPPGGFDMRSIVTIVVVIVSGTASAQDLRRKPSEVDAAIDRGLAFLAKDALAWKNEHNCVSCHHAALVVWSMREAKLRGHAVDEPVLAELTKWVAESGDGKFGLARPAERAQGAQCEGCVVRPRTGGRSPSRTPSRRRG